MWLLWIWLSCTISLQSHHLLLVIFILMFILSNILNMTLAYTCMNITDHSLNTKLYFPGLALTLCELKYTYEDFSFVMQISLSYMSLLYKHTEWTPIIFPPYCRVWLKNRFTIKLINYLFMLITQWRSWQRGMSCFHITYAEPVRS